MRRRAMTARGLALAGLLLAAATPAFATTRLEEVQRPFVDVVASRFDAFVRVSTDPERLERTPFDPGGPAPPARDLARPASGVAVGGPWVLTHAYAGWGDGVYVQSHDREIRRGWVVATLADSKLALVRVEGASFPGVPFAPVSSLAVGDWVIAVGDAFETTRSGRPSVTVGTITSLGASPTMSAAISTGERGAPVFDLAGRLAGIAIEPTRAARHRSGGLASFVAAEVLLARFRTVEGFEPVVAGKAARTSRASLIAQHLNALAVRLHPSVVSIEVERRDHVRRPRGRGLRVLLDVPRRALVTGFVLDDRGTIVTAWVNLADAGGQIVRDGRGVLESIHVYRPDGRRVPARLVGGHEGRGFAILRVAPEDAGGLRPAPRSPGRDLEIGRWVVALGNPFGAERPEAPLTTFGVVASQRRFRERYDAILTDAAVNPANAGGPVVDMRGRVVGVSILNFLAHDDGALEAPYGLNSGIGFVIPIELVEELLPRIEKEGVIAFRPGYLGIGPEETEGGVRVIRIEPDTGAARSELRVGDVITGIDGVVVDTATELRAILFSLPPDQVVTLSVRRGDEVLAVEVKLSLRPEIR